MAIGLAAFCLTVHASNPDESSKLKGYKPEAYKLELDLIGKSQYEWGVSLSGGGLRSSLFAYGALKALYDMGVLDKVDVVSSVSGGGYTMYSMVTTEHEGQFGSAFFDENNINEEICELITRGNFVTTANMLGAAFSLAPKKKSIGMYEDSIKRTYGRNDTGDVAINELTEKMSNGDVPFWIVNTTVTQPKENQRDIFEFTPLWNGSDNFGYETWSDSTINTRKTVAISGAAFALFLQQTWKTTNPGVPGGQVTLSDGGHSENLGALSLIKRGVENIIVIDAEHDPEYKFGAYTNLQNLLGKNGYDWKLTIEQLDNAKSSGRRLDTAAFSGKVTKKGSEATVSNIFYVKMSFPKSLDAVLDEDKAISNGAKQHKEYFNKLDEGKDTKGNWKCSDVQDLKIDLADWAKYNIASYSKYLNEKNYLNSRKVGADELPGSFFTAKFPQYTTADQSFYLDQALAYIGLGYYETFELEKLIAQ